MANDYHTKANAIIHQVIDRITIAAELLTIIIGIKNLAELLDVQLNGNDLQEKSFAFSTPFTLKRRGKQAKLIIGGHTGELPLAYEALTKTIANALRWMLQLQSGAADTVVVFEASQASANILGASTPSFRLPCKNLVVSQTAPMRRRFDSQAKSRK